MIKRTITVQVEVTPQELAADFARMDSDQQAVFFNELADVVDGWLKGSFCMQLQYITDSVVLTPQGRAIMEYIGEYADARR